MTTLIENVVLPPGESLSIEELTTGKLDGDGVLDVLLKTMREHLDREYKSNRINSNDYAGVYTRMMESYLGQAIQYSLAKSTLALELKTKEEQLNLIKLQQQQVEAEIRKIATETATSMKQSALVDAQICQVKAQTENITKETRTKLPVEVANLTAQGVGIGLDNTLKGKQIDAVTYDLLTKAPAEVGAIIAQTAQTQAQTDNLTTQNSQIVAETARIVKETSLLDKDLLLKQSQLDIQAKEILLKQAQVDMQTKQVELAQYELTYKTPAEVAGLTAQTNKTVYELNSLMPAQLANTLAQTDGQVGQTALYAQKLITEKAQVDATNVLPGSVLYLQNQQLEAQTKGYARDAEQKAAKILIDTWTVRYNSDPDGNHQNLPWLSDENISLSVVKLLSGVNVTALTPPPPPPPSP